MNTWPYKKLFSTVTSNSIQKVALPLNTHLLSAYTRHPAALITRLIHARSGPTAKTASVRPSKYFQSSYATILESTTNYTIKGKFGWSTIFLVRNTRYLTPIRPRGPPACPPTTGVVIATVMISWLGSTLGAVSRHTWVRLVRRGRTYHHRASPLERAKWATNTARNSTHKTSPRFVCIFCLPRSSLHTADDCKWDKQVAALLAGCEQILKCFTHAEPLPLQSYTRRDRTRCARVFPDATGVFNKLAQSVASANNNLTRYKTESMRGSARKSVRHIIYSRPTTRMR